ncbi:MAG: 4-hydroxy-tetrahydrodipicolinate reductase [Christensenella sp.]
MIKVLISGANGKMGQFVAECISQAPDMVVVAGVDKMPDARANAFPVYADMQHVIESVDVIIDFSRPDALKALLDYAQSKNIPAVLCTTGYAANEKMMIVKYSGHIPVFFSANMSLGVNLQMELCKTASEFLGDKFDIEIIEKHHNQKVDAPSGTALAIADSINEVFSGEKEYIYGRTPNTHAKRENKEIGIHAVRGGTVVGEHDVLFLGNDEVIEIHHRALSRQVFAEGAVRAAKFMVGRSTGLYSMQDIISGKKIVSSIYAKEEKDVIVTLINVPHDPAYIADIFDSVAKNNVNIDTISQAYPQDNTVDIAFSISDGDMLSTKAALDSISGLQYVCTSDITQLTIEGDGMARQYGVVSKLFSALSAENIKTYIVTNSQTGISFCINSTDTTKAIRAVAQTFEL